MVENERIGPRTAEKFRNKRLENPEKFSLNSGQIINAAYLMFENSFWNAFN